jgi:hypothetical protein
MGTANTQQVLFSGNLTGTTVSSAITIPPFVEFITISSKTDVLIWLCDSAGNKIALLPSGSNGADKQTFAVLELHGCDIKLQNDTTGTSAVYVTAYREG